MYNIYIIQLKKCGSDDEVRSLLCDDNTMEVLETIGYRGVPSKENLRSRGEIIRYVMLTESDIQSFLSYIFMK